jgi:TatD DNase family protein
VALLWTDSHCHLQEPLQDAGGLDGALRRALQAGVERAVCIGTDLESSRAAVELARRVDERRESGEELPLVRATVGLHPHDASDGLGPVAELLATEAGMPAGRRVVVGVGECGLDYYYEHSPREVQRDVFAAQVRLAARLSLALVVHTRDAWDDTIAILATEGLPDPTVIHCFTGGPSEAQRCLDLGAYLSFSGIVTFKNATELRQAALLCPLERLLVETDSPFLTPVPFRGKPNEPALVTVVGEAIAALRHEHVDALAAATHANAAHVYGLAPVAS